MSVEDITKVIPIKLRVKYHRTLAQMALTRSAELGRRVSMGFVIEELIAERQQLDNPDERSAKLYGSD